MLTLNDTRESSRGGSAKAIKNIAPSADSDKNHNRCGPATAAWRDSMDDPQPIDVERKAKDESNLLSLLTPREREVFELLRLAKQNKEIANALVIAERAARFHVENITRKLGRLRREIL